MEFGRIFAKDNKNRVNFVSKCNQKIHVLQKPYLALLNCDKFCCLFFLASSKKIVNHFFLYLLPIQKKNCIFANSVGGVAQLVRASDS